MNVLVVMLSKSSTPELITMTQNAIDALTQSTGSHFIDTVVVESHTMLYDYRFAHVIRYEGGAFNYNRAMKQGIRYGMNKRHFDYVLMVNNDIEPHPDCIKNLIRAGIASASPKDPTLDLHADKTGGITFGFRTTYILCGWFIAMRAGVIATIGLDKLLPDELAFWYQDNWIGEMLRHHGYEHGLVHDALCTHLVSRSSADVPDTMKDGQRIVFNRLKRLYGLK